MTHTSAEAVFDWHSASGRRSLILYAAGAILGLGLAGYTLFTAKASFSTALPPEDLALVNGRPILRSDFILQTQVETGLAFKDTTRAQRLKVVREMIDEEMLVQRGLEVDLASYDPDVRAALVNGVNLQVDADVLAAQPTEASLRDYFTKHQDKYSSAGVMRVVDLVSPITPTNPDAAAKAKADAASKAMMAGMTPDAAMKQFGLVDTKLVDREDNFDFGIHARLGQVLFDQSLKLDAGGVSPATHVMDESHTTGWHVLYMIKRVRSVPVGFDQVKDNVAIDLQREQREKVDRANLDYLRTQADVRLAPEYEDGAK